MERVNLGLEYDDTNNSFSFFEEEWDNPITHSRFRELCNSKYVFLLDNSNGVYCIPIKLNEDYWAFFGVLGATEYSSIILNWDSTNNRVVGEYYYLDWYFVPTSRTINGKALSSDITLNASDVGAAEEVTVVEISTTGAVSQALDAGKFYSFTGALTSLTLTLNASTGFAIYAGKFTTGSGWGSNGLSIPATVTEAANNDEIEASKTYEFSIVDNVIVIKEV